MTKGDTDVSDANVAKVAEKAKSLLQHEGSQPSAPPDLA